MKMREFSRRVKKAIVGLVTTALISMNIAGLVSFDVDAAGSVADISSQSPYNFAVYANELTTAWGFGYHIEGNAAVGKLGCPMSFYTGPLYIGSFETGSSINVTVGAANVAIARTNSNGNANTFWEVYGGGYWVSTGRGPFDTFYTGNLAKELVYMDNIASTISTKLSSLNGDCQALYELEPVDNDSMLIITDSASNISWQFNKIIAAAMAGKTVIVNVTDSNVKFWNWFNAPGGSGYQEWAGNILWNFGNAKYIEVNDFFGTILAPNATVVNYATIVGSVIADKYISGNNELHQINYRRGIPTPTPTPTPTPVYGELTLTKTVDGGSDDWKFAFNVEVTLQEGAAYAPADENPDTLDAADLFANGNVATVELSSANASLTIVGLPAGTTYEVTEADCEGYTAEQATFEGAISVDGAQVAFVNKWTPSPTPTPTPVYGDLTITKEVDGGDADWEFAFEVKVEIPEGATFAEKSDAASLFANGNVATIFLTDENASRTIDGLPDGTKYEVKEIEREGYTLVANGTSGEITANGANAKFVNTWAPSPTPTPTNTPTPTPTNTPTPTPTNTPTPTPTNTPTPTPTNTPSPTPTNTPSPTPTNTPSPTPTKTPEPTPTTPPATPTPTTPPATPTPTTPPATPTPTTPPATPTPTTPPTEPTPTTPPTEPTPTTPPATPTPTTPPAEPTPTTPPATPTPTTPPTEPTPTTPPAEPTPTPVINTPTPTNTPTPVPPTPTTPPTDPNPPIEIPDEPVPLANIPDGDVLGANRVPTDEGEVLGARRAAQTDDNSRASLWTAILLGSVAGVGAWSVLKKKNEDDSVEE